MGMGRPYIAKGEAMPLLLLASALSFFVWLCTALAEAPNGPIVATVYGKVIVFRSEIADQH